jgi:hypothetical protein
MAGRTTVSYAGGVGSDRVQRDEAARNGCAGFVLTT